LNSGCGIELSPDDLLETPCLPTSAFSYEISVDLGGKSTPIRGASPRTGSGSVSGAGAPIVWITKDDLAKAGVDKCGGTAEVTVTRIYTPPTTGAIVADCHNGLIVEECTTTVTFSDQTDPVVIIDAASSTLVSCDTTGLHKLLTPTVIDNCDDDISMTISVEYTELDPCFSDNGSANSTIANVTYTATDACGNQGSRTVPITILRPGTDRIVIIDGEDPLTKLCGETTEDFAGVGVQRGFIKSDGSFEPCDTLALTETDYICGYIASKVVEEIPGNDCGRKEFVTWSVLDWCDPSTGPSEVGKQFINYTDTLAPVFVD